MNMNELRRLMNLKMMDADGNGGGDPNPEPKEPVDEPKFTQEQVNAITAAEKRKNIAGVYKGLGFESEEDAKAFIEKYREQEENNKSELEKANSTIAKLEAEKRAEMANATDLEYRFKAMEEGCDPKSAKDIVVLAKAKMTDDKDFESALKEVKDQYPSMFNTVGGGTGGGGTTPRKKTETDLSGIGKRLAEQRKSSSTTKDNEYFK